MQCAEENLTENDPATIGDPQNPTQDRDLVAPNEQQRDDETNNVYQGQTATELHKQLNLFQERAESCIKAKDKALQEEKRQRRYLLESMMTAKAETEYWKKMADKKTFELKDKALEEEKMKCEHFQKNWRKAESELTYWIMFAETNSKSCAELADKKTIELKEKALAEEQMKSEQLEKNWRKAEAEVTHWKMLAEMKTKSCAEAADRLVKARRLYRKEKDKNPEEAHSSTGDNGDDIATKQKKKDNEDDEPDPWKGWRKRPRLKMAGL